MQTSPGSSDTALLSSLRLSTLLGTGRHGSVFLGTSGDASVAVKLPLHTSRARPRGDSEGAALHRFDHPNIISLLAGPLENGALVLEHCEAGTFADLLTRRPNLDALEIAAVIRPILDALDHVHETGWIHGDVAPSNIAFRADGTPVLIDFATARTADDGEIVEGNPAFVGPLRKANPILDVRSLAATALFAFGERNRWDHEDADNLAARLALADLVNRADAGVEVRLDDLRSLLDRIIADGIESGRLEDADATATLAPSSAAGHGRGSTRSFGPRPDSPLDDVMTRMIDSRLLIVFVVAVALALIGFEVATGGPADPSSSAELGSSRAMQFTPTQTVEAFGASWNSDEGVLVRFVGGEQTRWSVGAAGDVAAVGDWDCSGAPTLGIYRPSTGSWFTFDSWEPDATSSRPIQLDGTGPLVISRGAHGCAVPERRP